MICRLPCVVERRRRRRCAASRRRRSPRRWLPGRRGSRASRSRRAPTARRPRRRGVDAGLIPGTARPHVVATVSAESPSRHMVTTTASVMPKAVTTWSMASPSVRRAHSLDQHDRYDGRAGHREPEGAEVEVAAVRSGEDRLVERRRSGKQGDPLVLDEPHRGGDVERRDRVERGAGEEPDDDADLVAEGVEERVDHEVAVVRARRRRARPTPARRRWSGGARSSRPSARPVVPEVNRMSATSSGGDGVGARLHLVEVDLANVPLLTAVLERELAELAERADGRRCRWPRAAPRSGCARGSRWRP